MQFCFKWAVDNGPVLKVTKPCHDPKTCPASVTQWPSGAAYSANGSLILQFSTSFSTAVLTRYSNTPLENILTHCA